MHKPSGLRDYVIAGLLAASVLVFFSLYLITRRGYYFDAPLTADPLYVPNKALAGVAITLLAFTFLLGPLSRYFDKWDYLLAYRKELGIVGGFFALLHGIVSYFFLPLKFPEAWVDFTSLEFGAGLIGLFLLIFLFILSFKRVITVSDAKGWWLWQRWGLRLVILFTLVHVYVMKWSGWVKWIKQGGTPTAELAHPLMPGLGLLVMLFVTWVVIVRLYESLFLFKDFGFTPKEISMDVSLRMRGRRFFIFSLIILIGAELFVLTRWIS